MADAAAIVTTPAAVDKALTEDIGGDGGRTVGPLLVMVGQVHGGRCAEMVGVAEVWYAHAAAPGTVGLLPVVNITGRHSLTGLRTKLTFCLEIDKNKFKQKIFPSKIKFTANKKKKKKY